MPFDIHCDDCHEFSMAVKKGNKLVMQQAITELGYKSRGFLEKNRYCRSGELDRYILMISAPRKDEKALTQLIKESV